MQTTTSTTTVQAATDALYPVNRDHDLGSGIFGFVVMTMAWLLVIVTFPFSLFFCLKVVQQYERAVIFRFGRLKSIQSQTGIFFLLPCIESFKKVDTRSNVFKIPPQEVLTKESVTVTVDAVLYYRVSNAIRAITNVADAHASTKLLGQTTLRGALGQTNLSDLLSERDAISESMAQTLDEATTSWGIKVERVEITDVRLPLELQKAMAVEGEAVREAKARVIAAEGELLASHALREAANVLADSEAGVQLRYLHTLATVSAENNKTINFTLPIGLISALTHKGWQQKIELGRPRVPQVQPRVKNGSLRCHQKCEGQ